MYTRLFMSLRQSLLGEKFVWVGGGGGGWWFEGKFSVSFGLTSQDLGFGFGL
jgi:hypothetical protein